MLENVLVVECADTQVKAQCAIFEHVLLCAQSWK